MYRSVAILMAGMVVGCTAVVEEDPGPRVTGTPVDYTSGDVALKGYLAFDAAQKGKRPGVLVVHEWWGHNDYTRKRADMLAELGYTALALDMYGEGKNTGHPEDAGKFMNEVLGNIPVAEGRFRAALDLLRSQDTVDADRTAAIGYCFGGAVVLHMARIGTDLDGVVSFHGNLASMHTPEPGSVKAKVLVCHGAADPFVPQEQVDAFKTEMDDAGVDDSFVAYEGAKHAFTNPGATVKGEEFGIPLAYDEAADAASWKAMQQFFDEVFSE